ncbi:MAG: helix-turn-helix transcriptional regulator, partial [Thermoanaerobaculia bacterium]
MPREALPDLSIALTFLRSGQGWSQVDLGKAAGISPKILNEYERGRKTLTRERLEYLIAFLGVPPERIDATLALLAANRASSRARDSETHRRIEAVAAQIGNLMAGSARSSLSLLTREGEALQARQGAEILWGHLKRRAPAQRRELVSRGLRFRTWALCERVAAESIHKAPNHPREALELA